MNQYFCLKCGVIESENMALDHRTHICFNCLVKGTDWEWAIIPTDKEQFVFTIQQ